MPKASAFGLKAKGSRLLVLLLTIAACVASALYFVSIRGIVEAHTHIFYVPIVLAGMWYHKKAVYVALFLSMAFLLAIHFSPLSISIGAVARTATFVAIACLMGYICSKRAEGEEELTKSKAYTESIIQNFLDTLIVVDAEARIQTVNPATCDLLGYTEEEIIGQPVGIIFAEEEARRFFQFFRQPEKVEPPRPQDTIRNRELTYKTKDGRLIPMLFNASVLTDEGGNVTGVVAGAKDITELKLAAAEIRREKVFSQNIVATVPDSLLVLDKDLRIKSANRTFYETFQTEPEKVIGSSITDILRDEDGGLSAELTRLFGTEDMLENLELHYRSEILGERIFSITARGMLVAEEEEEEQLVVLQDITQRKRGEEALRESEEKYRNLIDQSQDAIYLLYKGKFELINKRFEELLGYTLKEVKNLGFDSLNLVASQSRAMVEERREKVARGESVPPWYEFTALSRDGTEIEVETSNSYIEYKGGIAVQGIVRDITERKRAEESRRKKAEQVIRHQTTLLELTKLDYSDLESTLKRITETASKTLGVEMFSVWFFSEDYSEVVCEDHYHLSKNLHEKGFRFEVCDYPRHFQALKDGRAIAANDACTDPHTSELNEFLKAFGIISIINVPIRLHGKLVAAVGCGHVGLKREWTVAEQDFAASIADLVSLALETSQRKRAEVALKSSFVQLAETVSRAMESHDPYTAGHQQKVAELARTVGEKMGFDQERLLGLYIAGLLHDIGKISIPIEILTHPGALSEPEWTIIRSHVLRGYEILENTEFPWPVADMARHHHERLDGSGYPDGLKGDEISLEVRILAVCDVVDAMSSDRPYRPARSKEEVVEELHTGRGIKYDPQVVDILFDLLERGELGLP